MKGRGSEEREASAVKGRGSEEREASAMKGRGSRKVEPWYLLDEKLEWQVCLVLMLWNVHSQLLCVCYLVRTLCYQWYSLCEFTCALSHSVSSMCKQS